MTNFEDGRAPLPENLKRAREDAHLTQEALARAANVSNRVVQHWEAGRQLPRWPSLVAIARVLGRDPSWFYARHDNGDHPQAA